MVQIGQKKSRANPPRDESQTPSGEFFLYFGRNLNSPGKSKALGSVDEIDPYNNNILTTNLVTEPVTTTKNSMFFFPAGSFSTFSAGLLRKTIQEIVKIHFQGLLWRVINSLPPPRWSRCLNISSSFSSETFPAEMTFQICGFQMEMKTHV